MPAIPRLFPHRICLIAAALAWTVAAIEPELLHASNLRFTPIVRAVDRARPSVVSIHGRKRVRSDMEHIAPGDAFRQVNGMGTGIVIDERGYIVTNYHVVEGVSRIQVTLPEGQDAIGRLIAHDPRTDLAIIKIDIEQELPVLSIGRSHDLMPGETVIAVGNAFGYQHTVTRGIISALHRSVQVSDEQKYHDLIQTDASINPGNSGGPLLNIDGDLIGINVAVRVGAQGIGFALPIDEALQVVAKLLSVERMEGRVHGVVGKTVTTATGSQFVVTRVQRDSPAEATGLQPGDVITEVAGRKVERALDFERALLGKPSGGEIAMAVTRDSEPLNLSLALAELSVPARDVTSRLWEMLGMRLIPISPGEFNALNTRYRGGLKVISVRGGGPAARQGIRRGDILVGIHKWETISMENVAYILDSPEFRRTQPVKFFILRGSDTLYGQMRVSFTEG